MLVPASLFGTAIPLPATLGLPTFLLASRPSGVATAVSLFILGSRGSQRRDDSAENMESLQQKNGMLGPVRRTFISYNQPGERKKGEKFTVEISHVGNRTGHPVTEYLPVGRVGLVVLPG